MHFGIWTVTDGGILNTKDPFKRIFFSKETLIKTTMVEGQEVYETLLNVMNFEKVSVNSLKVFNYAFLYATGKFEIEFRLELFEASVKVQSSVNALRRIQQLAK